MNKFFLNLFAFAALVGQISCSDDDDNGGGSTGDDDTGGAFDLTTAIDAEGNWDDEATSLFESQIDGTTATGADESVFAWTVAEGGTTLPTDLNSTENLPNNISEDLTLDANIVYGINGAVFVESGATLTIPAGTVLVADNSNDTQLPDTDDADGDGDTTETFGAADVIVVRQGGQIVANGTASDPVIFTSVQQTAGTWGGIVILGNAPINISNGNAEIADNVGEDLPYGGSDAADNSGTLNYVILAYPGTQINTDAEYNGFSFYAVGTGTTLTNLEVVQGRDDGFEWFGGTVSATNLYGQALDDTFDWAEGFTGTLSNIVANQPDGADHCIEADNLNSNNDATPRSRPTITNATFNSAGADDAIKLRRGTSAVFNNILINIEGTDQANFEIDDLSTALRIQDETTTFTNVQLDSENTAFDGNINL